MLTTNSDHAVKFDPQIHLREFLINHHFQELMEQGVTVIRKQFQKDLVSGVLESFKHFISLNQDIFEKHRDSDGHFPRMVNMHLAFPKLLELFVSNDVALGVQDRFFSSTSSVYTSLYFERGSAQAIHRDTPYFCTRPEYKYLGIWIALEDAGSENGCLQVIRKGHLVPECDRKKIALGIFDSIEKVPSHSDELWNAYQSDMYEQCMRRGLKVEGVEAQAGDTIIWHPQLPHGGGKILDISRTRHSFVMHVTPVGCPVYHQDIFFNPEKPASTVAPWSYNDYRGRKYAALPLVDFGHQYTYPISAFRIGS